MNCLVQPSLSRVVALWGEKVNASAASEPLEQESSSFRILERELAREAEQMGLSGLENLAASPE